jgi:hypothetical protein
MCYDRAVAHTYNRVAGGIRDLRKEVTNGAEEAVVNYRGESGR